MKFETATTKHTKDKHEEHEAREKMQGNAVSPTLYPNPPPCFCSHEEHEEKCTKYTKRKANGN